MIEKPSVFLFTALAAEAKPLVAHFKLKKNIQFQPFAIYSNNRYCLTVTGVGKVAMAAGVAYTLALLANKKNPVLINIGIAGHRDLPVATIRLADKLIDADNERRFYPSLIYKVPCHTSQVTTVSIPDIDYNQEGLIDMEASAFYQASLHFTGAEFIQCLKIVSDNVQTSIAQINSKKASEFIYGCIEIVEQLIQEMTLLQNEIAEPEPDAYRVILQKYHFSASEQQRLLQLLKQYQLLKGSDLLENFASAKALLIWLQHANQKMALTMSLG